MKKITIILLLIGIISLLASNVLAEEIIIPYQELPKSGIIAFNISAPNYENYTVKTNISNDKVNLNYPVEIFPENQTEIPFDLNYMVLSFPIVANKTLNVTLQFQSGNSIIFKNITFLITVNETIVDAQPVEDFQVINNTANIKLSFDTLPYNSTQSFLFKGITGTSANITSCGEWLSCPQSFSFITQESIINITYNVPKNTLIGLYQKNFTVQQGDKIRTIFINFNITEPVIIIPDLSLEECYAKVELTAVEECINAKLELQKATLAQIFALARAKQQNFTQIQEIEKLVMVGSVDKELKGLYDSCSNNLNFTTQTLNSCVARRDELQTDREHFMSQLDQKQIEFEQQKESLLNETNMKISQAEQSKKNWMIFFLTIIVAILSFLLYKKIWEKSNNQKLFG